MLSIKKEVKKKKATYNIEVLSWKEKKSLADKEEEALGKDIEEFRTWVCLSKGMLFLLQFTNCFEQYHLNELKKTVLINIVL